MKATIKSVENGWNLKYQIEGETIRGQCVYPSEPMHYDKERAFTYDFKDERRAVWNALIEFMQENFDIKPTEEKKHLRFICDKCKTYQEEGFSVHILHTDYVGHRIFRWIPTKANFCPSCGNPAKKLEEEE